MNYIKSCYIKPLALRARRSSKSVGWRADEVSVSKCLRHEGVSKGDTAYTSNTNNNLISLGLEFVERFDLSLQSGSRKSYLLYRKRIYSIIKQIQNKNKNKNYIDNNIDEEIKSSLDDFSKIYIDNRDLFNIENYSKIINSASEIALEYKT